MSPFPLIAVVGAARRCKAPTAPDMHLKLRETTLLCLSAWDADIGSFTCGTAACGEWNPPLSGSGVRRFPLRRLLITPHG
jgi:hypothetical protein